MSDTHPSVEDEIERALRVGLATAGQLADRVARARQELARDAQHRSEQEHRQLEQRFRAEGTAASARLAVVERPEWWHRATAGEIVGMYDLAEQWRHDQPRAAVAAATLAQQVQTRYGIEVTAPGADPDEVRAALARIELDRAAAAALPLTNQADGLGAAVAAVARAGQRDAAMAAPADGGASPSAGPEDVRAAEARAVPAYDTVERRRDTAAQMRDAGIPEESIAVAMRADVAQGRPAHAVAGQRQATIPRTAATRGFAPVEQRPDRSR